MKQSILFHDTWLVIHVCCGDTHGRKSLGVDRFELGGLSGDSQEYFGDLSHAGKTFSLRSQLNTDVFRLSSGRSGVLRCCEVCLSNTGVAESHVGLVTGCQCRTGNRQLSMQGVVLQTSSGENSTHPLPCVVASTRRGTTTDCDHPACGKGLSSRCRDQGGHPRRHHVATAGNVWIGQGRRSSEAIFEHGRSASEVLRTWLRYVLHDLACKTANASFFNCSSQFRVTCALPAIRAFSFFFLEVVWDDRKPALL